MSVTPDALTQHFAQQPLSATDMAAFVLAVLSALFAAVWLRDRERGMHWMALSFMLIAVYYAFNDSHLPTGPYLVHPGWTTLPTLGVALMTIGVVDYLDTPASIRRWALPLLLAPVTLITIWMHAVSVPLPRTWGGLALTICYAGNAILAYQASQREPGVGHGIIALAQISIPCVAVFSFTQNPNTVMLRYQGVLPIILFGMTLLTISLLRRRRALEAEVQRRTAAEQALTDLNTTLEDQVAQRTLVLQEMVAGLESFNRTISHDLRGPLGGIAGLARVAHDALQSGNSSVALDVLPTISKQADNSTKLVAALLALAQVGESELRLQHISLRQLVDEVRGQLTLNNPNVAAATISVHELPEADADADLLRPVLSNLLSNAAKFSSMQAQPQIEIGASSNDNEVTVYVKDNGVGFDAAAAASLFKPFSRLHAQRFEGHGIGLSIVRRAIERHGGRVWAQASPGNGACFYFTLPRQAA